MIDRVKTILYIDELDTDGHSPVKFICSGALSAPSLYYIKYRSDKSFKQHEIQCLVFELVCTALLLELGIPTPEVALVDVTPIALNEIVLRHNRRYLRPGVIAFGSKEVPGADLAKKIELIRKKTEFNKLQNPQDLIRICMFDLWVDNVDRHEENLNLIVSTVDKKLQYLAIDHAFAFGGLKGMNTFGPNDSISTHRKLIDSQYFKHVIQHIPKLSRLEIVNKFISCMREADVQHIVNNVFSAIPSTWQIRPLLEGKIVAFLTAEQRLLQIHQLTLSELSKSIKYKS